MNSACHDAKMIDLSDMVFVREELKFVLFRIFAPYAAWLRNPRQYPEG
jgi:hypothetical protein